MKSLRIGLFSWSGALLVASIGFLAVTPAVAASAAAARTPTRKAAPSKSKAKPARTTGSGRRTPAKAPAAAVQTAPGGKVAQPAPDEFADAYPGGSKVTPPDLILTEEGARKAEALAAFARALVAEDNAETDESLEGYKRTLALDPGYTDLAVKVAYELAKRNDAPGGIQVLKDAAKAAPKDPRPLVYLSQLYSKHLRKPDLALRYAEQAVALDPSQFAGYLALFELHIANAEAPKAEGVIERAIKIQSTDPKFWLQLGDLATRLYLKEDGSAEGEKVEQMNGIYRRAAELGAADPVIQAKVGDYFVLSRQVKEAIPFYLSALKQRTQSNDPALGNLREKLARAFVIIDDKDQAIQMLQTVVAEHPMRFETYELLGELFLRKGDMENALRNFEQTLLLDGSSVENYLRLSEIYVRLKHPEKAVDIMRQARAKFPDVPQVTINLAESLSQAKQHTEAMTAFAAALADAEQNHTELLNSTFYLRYGAAAERAGLIDKAAELLRESIRLDPSNSAEARNYLGYMWVDRGMNLEEAGEYIKKALETDPDNGAYLDSLGWYYYKKGEPERALKEILRAMENLKEEDAVVLDHLGDVYQALGKTGEALSYWQKSLALEESEKLRGKIDAAKQKVTKSLQAAPAPAEAR